MSTATESVKQEAGQLPAGTSLLDEIMSQSRMTPETEAYDIAKQGVAAFISNILASDSKEEPINKLLIDKMLVELDKNSVRRWMKFCITPGFRKWNLPGVP